MTIEERDVKTREALAAAQKIAETGEYDFVGIRWQEPTFELGEIDHLSKVWVDGDETDDELPGICTTNWEQVRQDWGGHYPVYPGEHLAVLVSNRAGGGEDYGELVMYDAVVADIIC